MVCQRVKQAESLARGASPWVCFPPPSLVAMRAHAAGDLLCRRTNINSLAGPRPRGFSAFSFRVRSLLVARRKGSLPPRWSLAIKARSGEGRMGGRSGRVFIIGGRLDRPCAVIFWLPCSSSRDLARSDAFAGRTAPCASQRSGGNATTPECGTVTPTGRPAYVRQSATPSRIPQAPLPFRVVSRSLEPRAPLGKERWEYRCARGVGISKNKQNGEGGECAIKP
jgi:hypothetical protein